MTDVVIILALIGCFSVYRWTRKAYDTLFGDREGNSGRYKHWTEE